MYRNLVDFYASDTLDSVDGRAYARIASEIVERRPDVLGLSALTDTFQLNLAIAAEVKRLDPGIRTLLGGVHPTLLPELTLGYPQVDAVCVGEGEIAAAGFLQSLDSLSRGEAPLLPGIVYKQGARIVGDPRSYALVEDIDSLPFPDKDLFYREDPSMRSHYFIQCSRGCPFTCSYCINDFLGTEIGMKRVRHRKPDGVIAELLRARSAYHPSFVVFVDECFGMDAEWASRFLRLYKEKVGLPFVVSVHPSSIDPQFADRLRDAGCAYVTMGVQSLNERSSEQILRRHTQREEISRAIALIRSRGMLLQCDHLFGIPGETEEDMREALRFYNENRPSLVSVFWLTYYPRTSIANYAKKAGLISQQEIEAIEHGRIPSGMKRIRDHHEINFWMNYFSFFPRGFVRFLLGTGLYRLARVRSFFLASALPRSLHALLHRNDWNRYYLKRILAKKWKNLRTWGPVGATTAAHNGRRLPQGS